MPYLISMWIKSTHQKRRNPIYNSENGVIYNRSDYQLNFETVKSLNDDEERNELKLHRSTASAANISSSNLRLTSRLTKGSKGKIPLLVQEHKKIYRKSLMLN